MDISRECQSCGLIQRIPELPRGDAAVCGRCNATLRRARHGTLATALVCALAAGALLWLALELPLGSLRFAGRVSTANLLAGPGALASRGYEELAAVVLATLVIVPAVRLGLVAFVLVGVHAERARARDASAASSPRVDGRPWLARAFRLVEPLAPWAMTEVFLLGAFVAYGRMKDLADTVVGPAVLALGGVMLATVALEISLDRDEVWDTLSPSRQPADAGAPLVSCLGCEELTHANDGEPCPRCRRTLFARKPGSIAKTWALVLASFALYVPANALPILGWTHTFRARDYTILGGVGDLVDAKLYPLAALVFVASVVVPLMKLVALSVMLVATHRRSAWRLRARTRLYRFVDVIGRWSMIDIFALTVLAALVRLGLLATIVPGPAAVPFCGVVVLTMIAARAFDPRLMWDHAKSEKSEKSESLENLQKSEEVPS